MSCLFLRKADVVGRTLEKIVETGFCAALLRQAGNIKAHSVHILRRRMAKRIYGRNGLHKNHVRSRFTLSFSSL
ncbi:hypothetical protein Q1695_000351 [Nippostrongylus brasiliensis]|nr:hypothetical protein Q1695_000351 [Nippostrongylus brasiliensis]